jgi:2-oxoisovalerate dehydrogenase E1 component
MLTQTRPRVPVTAAAEVPFVLDKALQIRAFEVKLLELFKAGALSGTVHTCVGQELCAAALHPHLRKGMDAFFASHRGHGHYLAYGGPADKLLAEMMGREGALCLGRGGTQNLCYQRFFSAGIQGGGALVATGYAWALRRRGDNAIVVVQLGDGTMGEGAVYEAFTFAGWLKAPVLFFLEHNGWAQSTDTRQTTPGDLLQRATGFGLEAHRIRDDDPVALYHHLGKVVDKVRRGGPFLQIVDTRRLMAHSKGDDNRPKELVNQLWDQDPLANLQETDETAQEFAAAAEAAVDKVVRIVSARPPVSFTGSAALPLAECALESTALHADNSGERRFGRVAEELNHALHEMMAQSKNVILIGEDLLDPYGGAFKVSRGLSSKFPGQVLSTPIAEAGIAGLANGMALAGMKPVAEIMFADFATLAADQLVNFAAKFTYMYGGQHTCPVTVRLVSGAGRGYGPTHSQSLERLFCGIPGLRVVALSGRHNPAWLLTHAVLSDLAPKVFVENKQLYAVQPPTQPPIDMEIAPWTARGGDYPPLCYRPCQGRQSDVTVVTYGGMTQVAEPAMQRLLEEQEWCFDYVVLTQLWPLDVTAVAESVRRTRRLVVVEENAPDFGVGSAVIAAVAQEINEAFACRVVGTLPVPIPSSRHLEDQVLPSVDKLVAAISRLM